MALDLSQLNAATEDLWNNTDPVDIKFTENVLTYMLLKNSITKNFDDYFVKSSDTMDGGKTIRVPLEYDESNSGSYGQTTVIPQSKIDLVNAAQFPWGGIFASNSLGLDDQVQNSGVNAMVDLADTYVQNVLKSGYKNMGAAVFNRTAGDNDAIKALVTDLFNTTTSEAYGNIEEDDMALWKANVNTDNSAISFEFLQKLWRTPELGQNLKKRPNVGITTEVLKDGYERTLQTQQRFQDQQLVQAGFDNVLHKGAPVCADENVATGEFFALNTMFLMLKAHQDYNWTTPEWIALKESGQPDNIYINTRFVGQLVCTHRKAQVYATGVTEPT